MWNNIPTTHTRIIHIIDQMRYTSPTYSELILPRAPPAPPHPSPPSILHRLALPAQSFPVVDSVLPSVVFFCSADVSTVRGAELAQHLRHET